MHGYPYSADRPCARTCHKKNEEEKIFVRLKYKSKNLKSSYCLLISGTKASDLCSREYCKVSIQRICSHLVSGRQEEGDDNSLSTHTSRIFPSRPSLRSDQQEQK